jgi:tRNA/tmRNA/rRNA uracil-C5-methylase (TrmA/RlmC/RlmD family)
MTTAELHIDSMAHGGDGVARNQGKVVFVSGTIPGDRVAVETVEDKGRFERARVVDVIESSPERVTPVCPHFSACGGCQWQMASYGAQLDWKREAVRSQLEHIGRIEVDVAATIAPSAPIGYRNRMDFRVVDGRPALNRLATHEPVAISECHLLVPALAIEFERLGLIDGDRVTMRHGVGTGETAVLVDNNRGTIHEVVAGRRFQITDRAFFQVNTDGAEHLVSVVGRLGGISGDDTVVDAYAGGGLFAATVGRDVQSLIAIESDVTAVVDLAVNAPHAQVLEATVEAGLVGLDRADVVIVDPPRQGLGRPVIAEISRLDPRVVVYVSCDPASFARDAARFVDAGFAIGSVEPIDMFPQTYHTELVAAFSRDR